MSWKPIDTAPKDGTYILAKSPGTFADGKAFVPAVVAWNGDRWSEIDGIDFEEDDSWDLSVWTELPPSDDGLPYAAIND